MPAQTKETRAREMDGFDEAVCRLTQKQQLYVENILDGKPPIVAYENAGYSMKSSHDNRNNAANKLQRSGPVKVALGKIRGLAIKRSMVTREFLVEKLLEQREEAVSLGQIGAANQSVMGAAKLMGLEVNKTEVNVNHKFEAQAATQELYDMLRSRGREPKLSSPDVIDAEVADDT